MNFDDGKQGVFVSVEDRFVIVTNREPPRQPQNLPPPRLSATPPRAGGELLPPFLRKEGSLWIAVLLVILVFAGCRKESEALQQQSIMPTRQVTDDLGRTVTVPVDIRRVVSTAPSVTENIFAVGAGDRLVGVTTFCNYPEEANSIAKIGDTMTPNMESIIALKPDVVFVSTASQIEAFTKTLESNGIVVYVTSPSTLDDVFTGLEKLGGIFGTQDKTAELLRDVRTRVRAVWSRVENERKVRVFVQVSREDPYTIGRDSFLNNLIIKAGGESVTADIPTAYPKLSKETGAVLDPEAIIISDSEDNKEPNDVFKNSPAVKNGRIYKINADILSRPGPRLVDALEQIAKDLHQDKFRNK